jgi:GTPase SAR1 family protein
MGCIGNKDKVPKMTPENTLKILCLGVGGCGKTTFIKQMKIIHEIPWSPVELQNFAKIIRGNYINGLQDALELSKRIGLDIEDVETAKEISAYRGRTSELTPEVISTLKKFYEEPAIQSIVQDYGHLLPVTHFSYFWDSMDRIKQDNYVPTDDDILRARIRTSGSNSTAIYLEKIYFEFYDVGGQKPERAKWEAVIGENKFSAVIYFVATDEYDVNDDEKDFDRSKMELSRFIFKELVQSSVMSESIPIILFLNRIDLLENRLLTPQGFTSFKETFPEYSGSNAKTKALEFIKSYYFAVVPNEGKGVTPIKCHYTCALDRNGVVVVWKIIRDILVDQALKDVGLK